MPAKLPGRHGFVESIGPRLVGIGRYIVLVDGDDEKIQTIEKALLRARETVASGYPRAYVAMVVEVVEPEPAPEN